MLEGGGRSSALDDGNEAAEVMIEVDEPDVDVSYVTARRPFRKPGAMIDYEIEMYDELAPGVAVVRNETQIVDDAIFGILVVEDAMEYSAYLWMMRKVERFGWTVAWHDTLAAARHDMATRVEAER